jgi:two-component system, cell cycle response regulator DivK
MTTGEGFTILVVDDDDLVRDTVGEMLTDHGYRVLDADSAARAHEQARTGAPDLILMDFQMPGEDGAAAVARLKADPATRRIPVVAFTGGMTSDTEKIVHAGCLGYIPKPVDAETLGRTVGEFVEATVARPRRTPARGGATTSTHPAWPAGPGGH